jgi:N-acetylglucosamine kinase-like BadF-type ATPase
MEAILAIDGGATHTRCLAINQAGQLLAEVEGGASNHLQERADSIRASLSELTEQILLSANLRREEVACLSAGLAGVDYDGYGDEPMLALFQEFGFQRCLVHGDTVIAHTAALGGGPGIIVIAGTGSSILGVDGSGRRAKVGGWGPVYGNEASAQWISRRALEAAARAYDGRGPATALVDAFVRTFGISDFRDSLSWIYRPPARDIASLCRVVTECAASGDPVAHSLFEDAAAELVEGVVAAASRLHFENSPIPVSYQGGVAEHCPLLIAGMRERLAETMPRAIVQAPRDKPVMGAYLLACHRLGWKALRQ